MSSDSSKSSDTRGRLRALGARLAGTSAAPSSDREARHAFDTRPIFCGICRARRPRAPDADQDICAPCLQAERLKAGLVAAPEPAKLDPELRPLREAVRGTTWVWVVVPHRLQSGVNSGGGFVTREGRLLEDGSVVLPPPYDGAPIHGKPYKRRSAADLLADKLSGLGPKKNVSRLNAAERIAKALRADGYEVRVGWDQERPGETIFIHAERGQRPRRIGVVEVLSDGHIGYDHDFAALYERGKGVAALVDKAIDGLDIDPSLNPPPKRRMEIDAREAAFDIASLANDEALALGVNDRRGYSADLVQHRGMDGTRPRQVILHHRTPGHEEAGRVLIHEEGRIELGESTDPGERAAIEALVVRALDGRRVVLKQAGGAHAR